MGDKPGVGRVVIRYGTIGHFDLGVLTVFAGSLWVEMGFWNVGKYKVRWEARAVMWSQSKSDQIV